MNFIKNIMQNFSKKMSSWKEKTPSQKELGIAFKQAFFQLFGLEKGLFFTRSDFLIGLLYIFILNTFFSICYDPEPSPALLSYDLVFLFVDLTLFFLFVRIICKRMVAVQLSRWWLLAPVGNLSFFFVLIAFIYYWVVEPVIQATGDRILPKEEFYLLSIAIMENIPTWQYILINGFYIVCSTSFLLLIFIGLYRLLKKEKEIVIIKKEDKQELVSVRDSLIEVENEEIKK